MDSWKNEIIDAYTSEANNCFLVHGNVHDKQMDIKKEKASLVTLKDKIKSDIIGKFDIVIEFNMQYAIRVTRGNVNKEVSDRIEGCETILDCMKTLQTVINTYKNLANLNQNTPSIGIIIEDVNLFSSKNSQYSDSQNAIALFLKGFANAPINSKCNPAIFMIADEVGTIHPILTETPSLYTIKLKLPTQEELKKYLSCKKEEYKTVFSNFTSMDIPSNTLVGTTLSTLESRLKLYKHKKVKLTYKMLVQIKKEIVEKDCAGLIEFIPPTKSLNDVIGMDNVKQWIKRDLNLWQNNHVEAMPMGYLFCGPVGTGKTFLVECIAGEAAIPMVIIKNFRDKWVGSSETNLEKIFTLIKALGRCIVFIDEADQTLGKRDSNSGDSGVSSRIYAMMAKEMSKTKNRGKILWILASSRPDLIEVDLKRPGRIDVKIPILPTSGLSESKKLIDALCKNKGLTIRWDQVQQYIDVKNLNVPESLTASAAEALVIDLYRKHLNKKLSNDIGYKFNKEDETDTFIEILEEYKPAICKTKIEEQVQLAINEATSLEMIPPYWRNK